MTCSWKLIVQDPLLKGQRCVILADGFYEWRRTEKEKQPFFIYFPQSQGGQVPSQQNTQKTKSDQSLDQGEVSQSLTVVWSMFVNLCQLLVCLFLHLSTEWSGRQWLDRVASADNSRALWLLDSSLWWRDIVYLHCYYCRLLSESSKHPWQVECINMIHGVFTESYNFLRWVKLTFS